MAGSRRKARVTALQALYEIDTARHQPDVVVDRLVSGSDLSEENRTFVHEIVGGVVVNLKEIDRNILRLAILEILFDNRVSIRVAINEAVELAKAFGSDNSAKFVNGVLGAVSTLAVDRKGD